MVIEIELFGGVPARAGAVDDGIHHQVGIARLPRTTDKGEDLHIVSSGK